MIPTYLVRINSFILKYRPTAIFLICLKLAFSTKTPFQFMLLSWPSWMHPAKRS